jgi:hypothetical protein
MQERFPGELETLRADNLRLRRLLKLSEQQARAAHPDQATLSGAPEPPVNMTSAPEDKIRFYLDQAPNEKSSEPNAGSELFRCLETSNGSGDSGCGDSV